MGFRISYIVAPVLPRELVAPLGLKLGVETDALPYDEWWVGTLKSNSHTVLWSETEEFVSSVAEELSDMSEDRDIIACQMNEDAGTAQATCYWSSQAKWRIEAAPGEYGLVATGRLPSFYASIAQTHEEQPFMVPLETAASISGFNHETDLMNSAFTRFFRITADESVAKPAPKKGLITRLLGR